MLRGGFGNVVLAPVSEVLARLLVQITDTVYAAKDVLIEKDSFTELTTYLQKVQLILAQLQGKNVRDTESMRLVLESLEKELSTARELIYTCSTKSRFYLLFNCRSFVKQVQDVTREIGRCLALIPMASMNVSVETRDITVKLLEEMQNVQFVTAVAEEEIVQKVESSMKVNHSDGRVVNELLMQIARAVGVAVDPSSLRQELEEFKKEMEEAELRKSQAEAMQMEQIIGFLSGAGAAMSPREKIIDHQRAKSFSGIVPFQAFYCPISQEIMEDPVEIESGQTFERSEIERWFAAGNRICPTTKVELESLDLKPDVSLRQSIEDWKFKNIVFRIQACGRKLRSDNMEEVEQALLELHGLCEENSVHGCWIAEEGLIPIIAKLLHSGQRAICKKTLAILCSLSANNDMNREKIAAAGALPLIVRSLARDTGEGRQAVALLLALSKNPELRETIGKMQGCILLLVIMLNCEDKNAAEDAKLLINNLAYDDQNVVQMAEANYFKPLALRLAEGSDMTKIVMASTLSRLDLTDQSKEALAHEGVIGPLVQMISAGKLEAKSVALGALKRLSTLSKNRGHMISAGAVPALLQVLFSASSVVVSLKEHAAATLANLAIASSGELNLESQSNLLESEETLFQLLSLLNLTGPVIQSHLLQALNDLASSHPSAIKIRKILLENGAIELLLPFCEMDDSDVRLYSVKLLYLLSQDGEGSTLLKHLSQPNVTTLSNLVSSSLRQEERAAAVGIIGNLTRPDPTVLAWLMQANALPAIAKLLASAAGSSSGELRDMLLENGTAAVLLFSSPSDVDLQSLAAKNDVIETLVHVLSAGPPLAKARAATALGQFSQNSDKRMLPIPRQSSWWCFASPEVGCKVHRGQCSVKGSFCLLQAEAIPPLIQVLRGRDNATAHEAALGALSTLLHDDTWMNGVKVIANAGGVGPIVRLLSVGSDGAKEKALQMLEFFFRVERYRDEHGSAAQVPLLELTQQETRAKPLAARILAHLNILPNQSSYF